MDLHQIDWEFVNLFVAHLDTFEPRKWFRRLISTLSFKAA